MRFPFLKISSVNPTLILQFSHYLCPTSEQCANKSDWFPEYISWPHWLLAVLIYPVISSYRKLRAEKKKKKDSTYHLDLLWEFKEITHTKLSRPPGLEQVVAQCNCRCCFRVVSVLSNSVSPIDGSPLGSSVPGILQARTLDWVAIAFSNACMHAKSLQSCPSLCYPMDSRLLYPQESLGKNTGVGCQFPPPAQCSCCY